SLLSILSELRPIAPPHVGQCDQYLRLFFLCDELTHFHSFSSSLSSSSSYRSCPFEPFVSSLFPSTYKSLPLFDRLVSIFTMRSVMLRQLALDDLEVELHLRLVHAWMVGDPSKSDGFFAFGTQWVDDEGTTIQGDSHKNFTKLLQSRIEVGSVYKVTSFGLRPPRKSFRTSVFPHCLDLTPTTQFALQPPKHPPFHCDKFHYVEFEDLGDRLHPPCSYLTDFVGKLVIGGAPNHVQRPGAVARVQNLTIANERGIELVVSLWADLSNLVDATTLALDSSANPIIIAFGAFRITKFSGKVSATSCTASRVCLQPSDRRATLIRSHFTVSPRPLTCVAPKFDSPEKLKHHVQESYRTLTELVALFAAADESDTRYRCTATIKGFESWAPWYYHACPHCYKAVAPNHADFWCSEHESILATNVHYKFRLKIIVSDSLAEATFVLLGMAAERIMPIPAFELVRAYPADCGRLPEAITFIIGQTVDFEVQLPKFTHSNPFGDFKICTISGLHIPRADLIKRLPPVIEPPGSPVSHNTPMPGDPEYVPPVPTAPSPCEHSPSQPSKVTCSEDTTQSSKKKPARSPALMKPTFKAKSPKKASAKSKSTSPAKTTVQSLARKLPCSTNDMSFVVPVAPCVSDDDQPLAKLFSNHTSPAALQTDHLPISQGNASLTSGTQRLLNVPSLSASASSPANGPSKSMLTMPLAKVKIEKLMSSATTGPATPASALGDGTEQELGRGKRTHAKKKLFSA
ncbi:Replication protein A 70 kDa DNA-binding subunit B, partial [Linum perenne]